MKKKAKLKPPCPNDNSEMHLVMRAKPRSTRGPMFWSCKQCDYSRLKTKGDN